MLLTSRMMYNLWLATMAVVPFSSASTGTSSSFGILNKKAKLPSWSKIQKDREKMAEYMELARQHHALCIQRAQANYYHGKAAVDASFDFGSLKFDDYAVKAAGSIPDFFEDLERKLFATSLFSREECQHVISNAESHFKETSSGEWGTLPSGQFDVAGFWIQDIPAVHQWFNKMVQERLFPLLVKKFPHFCDSIEDLVVDNAYLFKYTPETGRRTDVHTDSGCLSFTIALNGKDEYAGGGTWFEGLEGSDTSVIEMDVGGCTFRPGGVRHCGHAVTRGTRYIIGGFCMNVKKVEYVRMLLSIGNEEVQKNNLEKAQEALEVAIALNPDFDGPYSHLADVLTKQGKIKEAQQVLEHCFHNVNRRCGEIAYTLGALYLDNEEIDKSKTCMEACLEADDSDVDAMMGMAQCCAAQREFAEEEEWYHRLVSTPGAKSRLIAKAYCNLGVLHEGDDQEIEYYKKSLEIFPDSFPPSFSLGCACAMRKEFDLAIQAFRKAIDLAEEKSEEQVQALTYLYRVTISKLQAESPSGPASQEAMMKRIFETMGEGNYQRLAALRK